MNIDYLVKMANQIGRFFEAMPDRAQALTDVAGHLKRSWEPRMRQALLEHIDNQGGAGLREIVLQAVREHRQSLNTEAFPLRLCASASKNPSISS